MLYTTRQAGTLLGITGQAALKLAKRRNVGTRYPSMWLFTEEDIAQMKVPLPHGPKPRYA
jgi:hypothetical protein